MDRMRPDNPLADILRSRSNPEPVRIEAPVPEIVRDRDPEREPPKRRQVAPVSASARVQSISLRDMLSTRSGLRRALILTEILGPPKALRRDE